MVVKSAERWKHFISKKKAAQDLADAIRGLAEKFAPVRGGSTPLVLPDGKSIREVYIDPNAIAMGNLRVDVRPQPGKAGPKRQTIYDLNEPPIASNDVAELGRFWPGCYWGWSRIFRRKNKCTLFTNNFELFSKR